MYKEQITPNLLRFFKMCGSRDLTPVILAFLYFLKSENKTVCHREAILLAAVRSDGRKFLNGP